VVKLHCNVGDFSAADPRLEPLWELAAERGVPVVTHAGRRQAADTAADELDGVAAVLAKHPGVRMVLAHSGSPSEARCVELMERFPNLYADLTPVMDRRVVIPGDALERLAGRFLFGSDAPNNPNSAKLLASEREAEGLSAHALELLLGGAAERLVPLARE
ncbi:MAG: amidohydrolase family protein, partial [Hyphomicrobiales bacterium]